MATINAIAHLNELTKDVTNDYYLTPQVTGTLDVAGIINRLKAREIATKNVDGAAFVQTFLDECATASAEGYNVVTSFFRSSLSMQGVILSGDLGHPIPAEQVKVSVSLTQGEGAKKAISQISVFCQEQAGATGPNIQSVLDPNRRVANTLYVGNMALIEGKRLSLKGDDPSVGILFKKVGEATEVRVAPGSVSPNTGTKLQFSLPAAVAQGQWMVTVTTQSSSNATTLMKTPRSFQYPQAITVTTAADESESPDEV